MLAHRGITYVRLKICHYVIVRDDRHLLNYDHIYCIAIYFRSKSHLHTKCYNITAIITFFNFCCYISLKVRFVQHFRFRKCSLFAGWA